MDKRSSDIGKHEEGEQKERQLEGGRGEKAKNINMLQTENDYKRERELNLSSEVKQREEHEVKTGRLK